MSTQQEAFEAWALTHWRIIEKDALSNYRLGGVADSWKLWQVAQAAMPVAAVRVPMTEAQADALETGWFRKVSDGRMAFIRAIEVHHGIGAKPVPTLICVKCKTDRATAPCPIRATAGNACPFTGSTT